MSTIREIVKSVIPDSLWKQLGIARRKWVSRDDAEKSTQEVFSRIYAKGLWGRGEGSSGHGSEGTEIVSPYVDIVTQWASEYDGINLRAVDLGCGNFLVGSKVFPLFKHYLALDIVPQLIEDHRSNSDFNKVEFQCVNAIDEPLPEGDVIFVRQVMQHLSNDQISKILPKIQTFTHAIISEHLPSASKFRGKNKDKIHGGTIRLDEGSGVYLDSAPFSLASLEARVLLEVPGGPDSEADGIIQTTYYRFR